MAYHLQYKDCITIEILLKMNWKSNAIANYIWVHKSTISREIEKYSTNWKYIGAIAWAKRQLFKTLANQSHPRISRWGVLEKYILDWIKFYWSAEQIAWRWKKDTGENISKDTIYRFVYKNYPWLIKEHFRRKGKKYTNHWQKRWMIEDGRSIDVRPKEVDERKVIWDWEWDSIEDGTHKARIITEVERKYWYLIAGKSNTKEAKKISKLIYDMFINIPKLKKKTMTLDNWMEFKDHKVTECTTKMKVYFFHKHAPWQKGSNENTNWLLRQFIPKKTPILKVTDEELAKYVYLINNRPRKRLWYYTPDELFNK